MTKYFEYKRKKGRREKNKKKMFVLRIFFIFTIILRQAIERIDDEYIREQGFSFLTSVENKFERRTQHNKIKKQDSWYLCTFL